MHANRKSFRATQKEESGQPWIAPFLSSRSSLRHVHIWVWYKIYQIITVTAVEMCKHSYLAYHNNGTGSIPSQSIWYLCWTAQQWDSFSPVSIIPTMFHTHPFSNHGRYIVSSNDCIVTVTLKKECHTYMYSCILQAIYVLIFSLLFLLLKYAGYVPLTFPNPCTDIIIRIQICRTCY